MAGQVTVFPIYMCSFFFYMGLLEGLQPKQVCAVHRIVEALLCWQAQSAADADRQHCPWDKPFGMF